MRASHSRARPGPSTSCRVHGDIAPASASMRPLATSMIATAAMRTIARFEQAVADGQVAILLARDADRAAHVLPAGVARGDALRERLRRGDRW